jgi:preprotein translocase subunit SecF
MDKPRSSDKQNAHFYRVRMIHPKSLAGALGFVSFVIYVGVAIVSIFVALFFRTDIPMSLSMLTSLFSGVVVIPAFFFMLGLLIAMAYNAYAFLTGGILMEVSTAWNP